ncbi:MAG TPA: four helix bundle suffix domain-containing protein [Candidatus Acidoferrum sp.]|jgi:restriction system protein|nr:four helix bundle suffix domain-containing protein [Candidatus Acidoferrum sp.]
MTHSSESGERPGLIPAHGGYRELKSYQMAEIVYDATVKFCDRFIDPRSRTHDQMVQAARSGNKNITEGNQVSGTSKKMELKLVGVARASLEELLGDYQDFLRQRGLAEWGKNHPMAGVVRRLAYAQNRTYKTYSTYIENAPAEVGANTMLCLVHQTNYLLDQQLRQLEQAFLQEGGFTERLYKVRQQARSVPPRPSFSRSRRSPCGPAPNPADSSGAPAPNRGAATGKPPLRL